MEEKELKKSIDLLNNNISKLMEQQNEYMKSIKSVLKIFLFFFIVGVTIAIIAFLMNVA